LKKTCARVLIGTLSALSLWFSGGQAALASPALEGCFTAKINGARGPDLAVDGSLVSVARRHSQRMASSGTIFHNSNLPNEVPPGWQSLGENVGMGPSCDAIHNAFMNSASHRANILDPDFNFVGVGVVVAGDGTIFVTEVFMQKQASQPAQNPPAPAPPPPPPPPPPSTAGPAPAPRSAPRSVPGAPVAQQPQQASQPAPPPPPPPGSKAPAATRALMEDGLLGDESFPSSRQQKAYSQLLDAQAALRLADNRAEGKAAAREHDVFSWLAALVAAALSARV
jgi:hypothetical protein